MLLPARQPAPAIEAAPVAAIKNASAPETDAEPDALPAAEPNVAAPEESAAAAEAPAVNSNALDSFTDLLTKFLRSVSEGFETERGSYRYFYSESFKLELLKSVFEIKAPEDAGKAAETAATVIDEVARTAEAA